MANLRVILEELGSARSLRLKTMFEQVPADFRVTVDRFPPLPDLTPLRG